MVSNPKASVVVLTRNSSRTIVGCLDSILHSEYKANEIIVVDGGSTDGTLDLINNFRRTQTLKIIPDENKGLGYARDLGWKNSIGDYVIYVDSDVEIDRRFIGNCLILMQNDQSLGGVSGKLDPVCSEKGLVSLWMMKNVAISYHKADQTYPALEKESLHTGATSFRRSALEAVGGFDHDMSLALEDWTISYRLRKHGYGLTYIDVLCSHKETTKRFSRINMRYGRARTICQRKGYPIILFPLRLRLTLLAILAPPLAFMLTLHYYEIHRQLNADVKATNRMLLAMLEVWRLSLRNSGIIFELIFGSSAKKLIKKKGETG
ncbi:MAG: glycosyltransferase family 2 protein [Nitrososphaerales archaeon]